MYGLVNRSIEEMLRGELGDAAWEQICVEAGIEDEAFLSHQAYPDAWTYRLVGAAAARTGEPGEVLLRRFGRHWVLHTALRAYGALMRAHGSTFGAFLVKLPDLHARVVLLFPHLKPPRFRCADVTSHSMRLFYESDRDGLSPFVEGLLDGLAEHFGVTLERAHVASKRDGATHDEFALRWEP